MQTVRNLQPGTFYMFRLGYSLAAKSYDGPNVRVQTIGRKLGVDPFGGQDPHSPRVIWGPDLFDGKAAVNRPEMYMLFAARAARATIFLRAMATDGSGGENRVWFDAVCMEARPEIPAVQFPVAPPAPPPPAPPAPPPAPSATTYMVVSGDTLYGIARKFGVSVAALTAANNIANPSLIKPGQVLKIPR
ncbi:MAG: LysM peptidoglycan-binding domain-containing protein [Chloroflexi bacterium]|nr:LysM peptidoglycan-binding domain-containing protein [Chloroflexota bacterium]